MSGYSMAIENDLINKIFNWKDNKNNKNIGGYILIQKYIKLKIRVLLFESLHPKC